MAQHLYSMLFQIDFPKNLNWQIRQGFFVLTREEAPG